MVNVTPHDGCMITAAEENSRSKQISILKGLEDGSETKRKTGSESKHYCNLNIFGGRTH